MSVFAPVAGALLLALLSLDVFLTVFHPQGHGGPLTRRQNRAVWAVWKRLAPSGAGRDRWLALAGPLLSILTPAVWALLLVGGFALVYYPWIEGFLVSPGSLRAPWAEALYFSAYAAATLGTGDVVADAETLRLLSVLEALSGFALLSSSLSYILSIHDENTVKTTLASEIDAHFSTPGTLPEEPWTRERWLEQTAGTLLHVLHAHAQYPILHYFRPSDDRNALAVQLRPLVERAQAGGPERDDAPHAERVVLGALDRYLRAADSRFLPPGGGGDEAEGSDVASLHRRLLAYLAYDVSRAARSAGGTA